MVPEPGVSLNDQFGRDRMLLPGYVGGLESSDRGGFSRWVDFDVCYRTGCHDCQEAVARERFERSRSQRNRPYRTPCSLAGPAGRAYALHPVQRGPHHGQFRERPFANGSVPMSSISRAVTLQWHRGPNSCRIFCGALDSARVGRGPVVALVNRRAVSVRLNDSLTVR